MRGFGEVIREAHSHPHTDPCKSRGGPCRGVLAPSAVVDSLPGGLLPSFCPEPEWFGEEGCEVP
eukprot:6455362-Heterocapsa_arctica.AAC.1